MKVGTYSVLIFILSLLAPVSNAQNIGIGASYIFDDELDDVYGVVSRIQLPVYKSFFTALRIGTYLDVNRSTFIGPTAVDVTADAYPVDVGLGWQSVLGDGGWTFYSEVGFSYTFVESDIKLNGAPAPLEVENDYGWYAALGF